MTPRPLVLASLALVLAAAPSLAVDCGAGKHDDGMGMCVGGTSTPSQPQTENKSGTGGETPAVKPSLALQQAAFLKQDITRGLQTLTTVPGNAGSAPGSGAAIVSGGTPGPGARTRPGEVRTWLQPDLPCDNNPRQNCYFSQDKLQQIAEGIQQLDGFQDIAPLAKQALLNPQNGDKVEFEDITGVFKYLQSEQHAANDLGKLVPNWQAVKDDPTQLSAALQSLKPEIQDQVRARMQDLKDSMTRALATPDENKQLNPFHMPIMTNDKFADTVMKGLDAGPIMPGGWGNVDQGNPAAWNYDAQQALQGNNPQKAAQDAQQALSLDPKNEQALSTLAAAKYDLKDMSGAAEAAGKALELNPNDAQAQTVARLAHDLVAGDAKMPSAPKQEHSYADVPAGLSGANAPWHDLKLPTDKQREAFDAARSAERALNRGDLAGAKAAADRAIAADPHSGYAYGLKAFAEIKGGDSAAALRDAVAGLALSPADRMALKARAQSLLQLGNYRDGLLAAEAAVAGDPRSAYAHYLLAEARAANGDRAGAREALKQAAALDMRYADMYKASLQVADNGDMAFLFPDLKSGALAAAAVANAGPSRAGRLAKVAGGAAAGGGLLAWLLWQLFGASLAPALKTVFTRKAPRAAEPVALEPAAAPAGGPAPKEPGLLRGQYKTVRQIGMGGMGMVYEGSDVSLNRRVAIKKMRDELRLDRRQRERFVQEAKLVAALHHPNVVDIYAIVDDKDELALIFEYVNGKTLHEIVHGRGPLPFADALRVYRGVASALEYAHGRGIIHRDLKPSNVMVTDEGAPKVMDFGIARTAKDAMTRYSMTNTIVGTPPYMAPEQEQGVVRKESDVYALAVCFYETVTGALPFAGTGGGMIMNKVNKAYTAASKVAAGLPPGLDEVFDKAFEPDPDKRYRSVAELQAALEALPVSAAA